MPDTPAPALLSEERLAEIEAKLAISTEAFLGNDIDGDDVAGLIAMYKGQKLLYNETSRIANKHRQEYVAYRLQVAEQLRRLLHQPRQHEMPALQEVFTAGLKDHNARIHAAANALGIEL